MSELGNKNFIEEQTTAGGMSAFLGKEDDEAYSMQNYAQGKSRATASSFSNQSMTGKGGLSVASQGYKPRTPTTERGLDLPPFDINAFDPGNADTYPQDFEDFDQWFEEWWIPRNYDLYRSFVHLAGTNSISGLGGQFRGIGTGGPDPEQEVFWMIFSIYLNSSSPPIFDENGNNIGGYCLGCEFEEPDGEGDGDGDGRDDRP